MLTTIPMKAEDIGIKSDQQAWTITKTESSQKRRTLIPCAG
jgi:hypothetical protein